ncbi:MAG: SDR family NAD(P)-dependent oxidoreductase [Ottowia sp.]|uniref:SDR family NAD(P)-dependent oxidoreductase n=1 Tax=Ottowia sp. TaxID=1898956 RepID=UPI003C767E1C
MKEFKGRTALITGAGSGLGAAIADVGASLGMRLVLADIDNEALQAVGSRLAAHTEVTTFRCDVADSASVKALSAHAVQKFGAVHLLFNNAGVGGGGGFAWESRLEDWQWGLGVNLWGVIHGIHHVVPTMVEAALADPSYEGHVINTSSMAGFFNPPIMAVYNASKQAVTAISETLHHDLDIAGLPIHCSVLSPFFVSTNIDQSERHRPMDLQVHSEPTSSQQKFKQQSKAGMGSGRVSAEDVAKLTFEAIREERFYIFPHPRMLQSVEQRMNAIVHQLPPVEPFAYRPEIYQALKEELSYAKRAAEMG